MHILRLLLIVLTFVGLSHAQQNKKYLPFETGLTEPAGDIASAKSSSIEDARYSVQLDSGLAQIRAKQYERAILTFNEVLRLRPELSLAWQSLGFALYYQEQYEKAVDAFREAQRLAPEDVITNNNLGFAYLYLERYQEAVTAFQGALRINPKFPAAINGLCSAQAFAGNTSDALQPCLVAAANDRASAVPHYFLGLAYLDLGEAEKALSSFQKAVSIEPDTAKIYVGLGFVYFKLKKPHEALKNFEYARKLDPKVNHALVGIGATYAHLKDYAKAEEVLREAVSSEPDSPTAQYNLGMVCFVRSNRECALSQYNRLKIMGHPLAKTLFTTMFRDRVVNVSQKN